MAADYISCEGVVLGPEDACEECPTGDYRVTWKAPRTKGLEVRLYGVTECLSSDIDGANIDGGWCLREAWVNDIYGVLVDGAPYVLEHIAIPPSLLVPLTKAKATKGKVTFDLDEYEMDVFSPPDDPDHDKGLFAIVVAVYDSDGQQSPFTVVYSSHYCEVIEDLDCPESYYSQMGYYMVK